MTADRIWRIYNFVNDWKNGKFGIKPLSDCLIESLSEDLTPERIKEISEEYVSNLIGTEDKNLAKKNFEAGVLAGLLI